MPHPFRLAKSSSLALVLAALGAGAALAATVGVGIDTPPAGTGSGAIPFSLQTVTQMSLSSWLNVNQGSATQAMGLNANDIWMSNTTGGWALYLQPQIINGAVVLGTSTSNSSGNMLYTQGGGLATYHALPMPTATTVTIPNFGASPGATFNAPTFGGYPHIFANGDNHGSSAATAAAPNGGGVAISNDGGFYDYNDAWITYNGSNVADATTTPAVSTRGLMVEGTYNATTPSDGTLYVIGQVCLGAVDAAHCVIKPPGVTGPITQYDIGPDNKWHDLGLHSFCYESGSWGAPNGSWQEVTPNGGSPGAYDWQAMNSTGSYGFPLFTYGYSAPHFWIMCTD
ncbi:MAG: hypothetical protein P4M15_07900 [Alphaproteobacteria bacterium]|nr:hypothetical protein [Alphaproteobacteria bacterium]